MASKEKIGDIECVIMKVQNYDLNILKQVVDAVLNTLENGFVFVANVKGESVNFIAKAQDRLKEKIHCGNLVKEASIKSNGSGGGSPLFAQGGGKSITSLAEILEDVKKNITELEK